MSAVLAQLDAD